MVELKTEIDGGTDVAFIRARGLVKRFPGSLALDKVDLDLAKGEIHALVGENGAGKSTLIKILAGIQAPDEGEILLEDEPVAIQSPSHAQRLGITTIHQELSLAPDLTALQNIFLGRELRRKVLGRALPIIDEAAMERRVLPLCDEFGFAPSDLRRPISQLGALKQHVTEILKALAFRANLVIMDEPTAGLTDHEREALFGHMRALRERGISVLWVTHRLEELIGLADRASVLRDGKYVATVRPDDVGVEAIVRMMVGREVQTLAELTGEAIDANGHGGSREDEEEVLRVEGLTRKPVLKDVSFQLRRGEILGIAGLAGAGRTELARAIIGVDGTDSGSIYVGGQLATIGSPSAAYRHGIALVPEERKVQGIFSEFSVAKNISAAALHRVARVQVVLDRRAEDREAKQYVHDLGIRTSSIRQKIRALSGGNQQKALIARCLFARPSVVIFDEPTQGIDIGAKTDVYRLINHFAHSGGAAIVISSELPELIGISDRILVMRAGEIAGEVPGGRGGAPPSEAEREREEQIMMLASGRR